jgi:hypothetical protein
MKFNQFDNLIESLNTRQSALTKETEAHLDRALSIMDAIDSMFAPNTDKSSQGRDVCVDANTDKRCPDANVCVDANKTPTTEHEFCQFVEVINDKYHIKPFHPRQLAQVTHELQVLIAESDPHYAYEYFGGE